MRVLRIRPSGRQPSGAEIFIGRVATQTVIDEGVSDRHRILEVTFTQGARTKLHAHVTDQVLLITSGSGVVGTAEERFEVEAGDVVFIPAREPHFHGAAERADMTHYSVLGPGETTVLEG
jgi:quercetin dioxygenase-like cupin family protein